MVSTTTAPAHPTSRRQCTPARRRPAALGAIAALTSAPRPRPHGSPRPEVTMPTPAPVSLPTPPSPAGGEGMVLDVLIVGAGQAGLALGQQLAARGEVSYLLVDGGSEIGSS